MNVSRLIPKPTRVGRLIFLIGRLNLDLLERSEDIVVTS